MLIVWDRLTVGQEFSTRYPPICSVRPAYIVVFCANLYDENWFMITENALLMSSVVGNIFRCECLFSVMKNK